MRWGWEKKLGRERKTAKEMAVTKTGSDVNSPCSFLWFLKTNQLSIQSETKQPIQKHTDTHTQTNLAGEHIHSQTHPENIKERKQKK